MQAMPTNPHPHPLTPLSPALPPKTLIIPDLGSSSRTYLANLVLLYLCCLRGLKYPLYAVIALLIIRWWYKNNAMNALLQLTRPTCLKRARQPLNWQTECCNDWLSLFPAKFSRSFCGTCTGHATDISWSSIVCSWIGIVEKDNNCFTSFDSAHPWPVFTRQCTNP